MALDSGAAISIGDKTLYAPDDVPMPPPTNGHITLFRVKEITRYSAASASKRLADMRQ
jgi:hypothetical protein